jgi:hypothetical protein
VARATENVHKSIIFLLLKQTISLNEKAMSKPDKEIYIVMERIKRDCSNASYWS